MTALYTLKIDTSATIDVTVTLDIEADTEAEALQMFEQEARAEINRLVEFRPWGMAEIEAVHIDHVPADLIEIVEVEQYEDDDDDEPDADTGDV